MKKRFCLKNGVVRIVCNEENGLKNVKTNWVEKKLEKETRRIAKESTLSVEAKAHRGGRMCYGMLSVRIRPSAEKDVVEVRLATTEENTIMYEESLMLGDEHVYCGFPAEYVDVTLNGIVNTIKEKEVFPQCEIVFESAANSEESSSAVFFGYIADMIINMISSGDLEAIFDMDQEMFIESYIKGKKIGDMLC